MSSKRTWLNIGITLFNGKISLTFLFLLLALPAFGAGGTCPSGANYTNPANPLGPLVTLSSLGVTSCYFIADNGSDSNDGLSEASGHPWLHAPAMPNCSNNCLTLWNNTIPAGTGFIFRGGDTWHFGNSGASPSTGGTWEFNISPYPMGTSSNPIYIGFDQAWYSGGSFARPIMNADNSLCNASTVGTLPDGATCTGATNTACLQSGQGYYNQPCYYVSSCPYQVGSNNWMIDLTRTTYYTLDNFEWMGLCESDIGQPFGHDVFIRYGSAQGPLTFINNYFHGTSHLQFGGLNTSSGCTASNVCINIDVFVGSVASAPPGENILLNVLDFSDSDPGGQQVNYGGFWNVAYNAFRYYTNSIDGTLHLYHDNLHEYFFEDGHSNLIESNDLSGANAIYNNVFRHIETSVTSGGGVFLWLGPASGATDYIFNNIGYDVGNLEYLNNGGNALTTVEGNYVWFNNTWQTNNAQPILRCNTYKNGTVADTNTHYIDDQNYLLASCPTLTTTTYLWQSNTSGGGAPSYSDANTSPHFDQYTSSETYAYSPVASTNSTVGAGTNEYSGYCSALSTAGLSAAATACQSDITYACSYAGNGAPPVCPARTVTARPTSAAWDIGAYEFNAQDPPPNAPTYLSAVVN